MYFQSYVYTIHIVNCTFLDQMKIVVENTQKFDIRVSVTFVCLFNSE